MTTKSVLTAYDIAAAAQHEMPAIFVRVPVA